MVKNLCILIKILMPIIMSCRVSLPEAIKLRSKLRFKQHDIILSKEQLVISRITKLFLNEQNTAAT